MTNRRPTGLDLLEYEIAHERMATLARLGQRLEGALAALRSHDEAHQFRCQSASDMNRNARAALVSEAAEALWYFVIQRELTGFHDRADVMRDYRVPREVQVRMGVR
jgi:hypothetical protein